ncbi:MAG TPA: hypothetical protein DC064_11045 [Cyanobacteria bacterium UBA9273]|nr:hypothetical protein [Cyanobacteria bacterium UBA9273]
MGHYQYFLRVASLVGKSSKSFPGKVCERYPLPSGQTLSVELAIPLCQDSMTLADTLKQLFTLSSLSQ